MIKNQLKAGLLTTLLVVSIVAGAGALSSGVLAADGSNDGPDGNNNRANATMMDADSTASGTIESGDVDWYAVEVEAGQGIYGELTITTANDENLRFDIFTPDGEKIGEYPNDALGPAYQTKRLVAGNSTSGGDVAEQSGTYYVRVKGADEGVSEATSYDLTVTTVSIDAYDPNEQPAMATSVDIASENVSGALTGYDRDTYAIDLQKGETVTIDYERSNGFTLYAYLAGPNASDAMLDPYYKGKYAVASKQVGGPNEFNYTANKSGTYYIRVVPYVEGSTIGTFDEKVSYEMSVSVSGDDEDSTSDSDRDSDDSRANATMIDVGETVNSTLASGNDSDWYAVDLENGQGFTAFLEHTNRKDPSAEVSFDVYAPNGDRIGEAPFDRPLRAYQTSPAAPSAYGGDVVEQSGTYYIRVQGIEGANYSLNVNTVPLDEYDPNEQPDSATAIESGDTISGLLTGYDRDVYAIDAQKGDTITIEFNQSDGFTTALYVADPTVPSPMSEDYYFEENLIAKNDPFTEGPTTFTANQTGTYYIKVVPYAEDSTASTFFRNATYEMTVNVSSQSDTGDSTDKDGNADDTDDKDNTETETPRDTTNENESTEESDEASADTDTGTNTDADTDTNKSEQTDTDEEADQSTDDADDTTDTEEISEEETDETATDSTKSDCDDEQQTATTESDCPEETTKDDPESPTTGTTTASSNPSDCEETDE
jgi:hypothetical protein